MTGEIYSIIVRAGMEALMAMPKQKRARLCQNLPHIEKMIAWVDKHPTFRSASEDKAMKFIEKTAEKLKA